MENNLVDLLFDRAQSANIPMNRICERAGVAVSTPSRWRGAHHDPSFKVLRRMNAALDEIISEQEAT